MLEEARDFVSSFRYAQDVAQPGGQLHESTRGILQARLSSSGLVITEYVLPNVELAIQATCDNLHVPRSAITAYAIPRPQIAASCFVYSRDSCMITVSSKAIERLKVDELSFVIGHEIGHFLFCHNYNSQAADDNLSSVESFMLQRTQEISSDRCGLLACQTIKGAVRAIMKTVSGLDERNIRFDVSRFLTDIAHLEHFDENIQSTHPPMMVRCRALLWFSMSNLYSGDTRGKSLKTVDEQIERDLRRFVDGPAHQLIDDAASEVALWTASLCVIRKGRLSAYDREILADYVEADALPRLLDMLNGMQLDEAERVISSRLSEAVASYRLKAPRRAQEHIEELVNEIGPRFDEPEFADYIRTILSL